MRRRLLPKSPGNRKESRETSHIFPAAPIGNTTSTPPRVSAFLKITMCARIWGRMHCETPQQRKIVLPDFIFFHGFSCDSSDHAFRPRLPTTPSGHAFRPRLSTSHSNRGTSFSSMLGSWGEPGKSRSSLFAAVLAPPWRVQCGEIFDAVSRVREAANLRASS